MEVNPSLDLPLLSNVDEVRVRHNLIRFNIQDMEEKIIQGEIVMFLELIPGAQSEEFKMILDAKYLNFTSVKSVNHNLLPEKMSALVEDDVSRSSQEFMQEWFKKQRTDDLSFEENLWSLEIWNTDSITPFPNVIYIQFSTRPEGPSLSWSLSQSGQLCAFTAASNINNRSLFPCQEPPVAMSTWQAEVTVQKRYTVLCTGEINGIITQLEDTDLTVHYFYTLMVLPISTFALAIGEWDCLEILSPEQARLKQTTITTSETKCQLKHNPPYPCHMQRLEYGPLIQCRLYGTQGMLELARNQGWQEYIPACLEAAYDLLGRHPFVKLDILVVPRNFSGLGLASPNLCFLSQSLLLGGDSSMMVRIAHEISHSWFGIVIGPKDFTEEWISEGFATFTEDFIHTKAMTLLKQRNSTKFTMAPEKLSEISRLRSLIRYRTLNSEVGATSEDLQLMRPMHGQELRDSGSKELFVKNGLNPEIAFTQVHYIKGCFLLRHLHDSCPSSDAFFSLLRNYVNDLYHGSLVHSTDFLKLFFDRFGGRSETMETVLREWCHTAGMSPGAKAEFGDTDALVKEVALLREILEELEKWKWINNRKRKQGPPTVLPRADLCSEQIVLLLEYILELPSLTKSTLKRIHRHYSLSERNADVLHRWCELILTPPRYLFREHRSEVEMFLREHQAMGIYMYGEMAAANKEEVRRLGMELFKELEGEMEQSLAMNVREMQK